MIRVPLRDRKGRIDAYARIDDVDASVNRMRWYRLRNGYVVRTEIIDGKKYMRYLHRELLAAPADVEVDHINGDRLDNTRGNLRLATPSQNSQNRGANRGRDLPRGVSRRHGRYRATAKLNGKLHELGLFATVDEADRAARTWRAENMPFSADARDLLAGGAR